MVNKYLFFYFSYFCRVFEESVFEVVRFFGVLLLVDISFKFLYILFFGSRVVGAFGGFLVILRGWV